MTRANFEHSPRSIKEEADVNNGITIEIENISKETTEEAEEKTNVEIKHQGWLGTGTRVQNGRFLA